MKDDNEFDVYGVKPDLLEGYDDAASGLGQTLQDAERRLKQSRHDKTRYPPRIQNIQVHIQTMRQYENLSEKERVMDAASEVLEATIEESIKKREPESTRFNEALAALKEEERRGFVTIIDANTSTLVYWNWTYGYEVATDENAAMNARLAHDIAQKNVARPEHAGKVYGDAATRK